MVDVPTELLRALEEVFPQATPLRLLVASERQSRAQRELTRSCPRRRPHPPLRVGTRPRAPCPSSLGLLLASLGSGITLDTP